MVLAYQLENEAELIEDGEIEPYIGKEIDLLYDLPMLREMVSAVYFIFDGPELIYVGSSNGVANRLNYWIRDKRYGRIKWTQIGVMPVPSYMRFTVEWHYIERFQPWLNKAGLQN